MHKVMRAAEEQGFREGRLLLQDWLTLTLTLTLILTLTLT